MSNTQYGLESNFVSFDEFFYGSFVGSAMEAPTDITRTTAQQMDEMGTNPNGTESEVTEEPVEDEEEVATEGNETEETDETNPIEETDTTDDEEYEEDTDNEDDSTDEDSETDTEEEPIEDDTNEFNKKIRIHENTVHLLNIIKGNKESFELQFSNSLKHEEMKDYHTIIDTFTDLIDTTEKILQTKFIDADYNTMVRYYVSLCRVYDIIIRMVENFVTIRIKNKTQESKMNTKK